MTVVNVTANSNMAGPEGLPLRGTWALRWLARYCPPGGHAFASVGPLELRCTRCGKCELASGATCLVCELPGSVPCLLTKDEPPPAVLDGELCGPCHDDFLQARAILGWTLNEVRLGMFPLVPASNLARGRSCRATPLL